MTPEGRIAASILMVLGIALFGVITATTTGLLMADRDGHEEPTAAPDPIDQLGRLFSLATSGAITSDEYQATKAALLPRIA